MELSLYQNEIIDKVVNGNGNIMIQAYAGCGKTSTLIEIMKVIGADTTKFYCAFNKDIINDITKKSVGIENLKISTIHSLGYSIIKMNNDFNPSVDEFKYHKELYSNIDKYTEYFYKMSNNEQQKYISNIKHLLIFCRNNLCDGIKGIALTANKFGIMPLYDEIEVTKKLLKWGKENILTIDYADMVWLPNVLPYRFPSYDYIFVDEAQDLSIAQQQIVLKCRKISTRYIFCGDKFQSIYAFSGADSQSFDNLSKTPNTTSMPLPICYRCDDSIVDFAAQIVFGIERNCFGVCGNINFNGKIENIQDGDMVLCRNNAPLVRLYLNLIAMGKKCHMNGKGCYEDIVELIEGTSADNIGQSLTNDGIISQLYRQFFKTVEFVCNREMCDIYTALNNSTCRSLIDNINTIIILSEGLKTRTELLERIDKIFNNDEKDGISLSTIHKAKGLECNNVHILCWSLFDINLKRMEKDWEKEQERNLKYVAITRAKHNLSIIDDDDYLKYSIIMSVSEYESLKKKIKFSESATDIDSIKSFIEKNRKKPITISNIAQNKTEKVLSMNSVLNKIKKRTK